MEADSLELLVLIERVAGVSTLHQAVGDWALIVFYYLLLVGDYKVNSTRNESV